MQKRQVAYRRVPKPPPLRSQPVKGAFPLATDEELRELPPVLAVAKATLLGVMAGLPDDARARASKSRDLRALAKTNRRRPFECSSPRTSPVGADVVTEDDSDDDDDDAPACQLPSATSQSPTPPPPPASAAAAPETRPADHCDHKHSIPTPAGDPATAAASAAVTTTTTTSQTTMTMTTTTTTAAPAEAAVLPLPSDPAPTAEQLKELQAELALLHDTRAALKLSNDTVEAEETERFRASVQRKRKLEDQKNALLAASMRKKIAQLRLLVGVEEARATGCKRLRTERGAVERDIAQLQQDIAALL